MPIKVTGWDSVERAFKETIAPIKSPKTMRELGLFIVQMIKQRTRGQGQGVSEPGGNQKKLKRVSKKYAAWRAEQKRHPEAATGQSSNLTFSGKLLDNMIVKRASEGVLFIGFRNQKQEDIAVFQEQQGRRFLVLSGKEISAAAQKVIALTRKQSV